MAALKCDCYISIDGAAPVLFDSLSKAQKDRCKRVWSEKLSSVASAYYNNHPEERAAL